MNNALGLLWLAAGLTGDPVITDPTIDQDTHPPVSRVLSIDSQGERMNGLLYLAQGPGPHPTVVLLHGFPGHERNLDLAQAIRRSGTNVLFFHYRGAWGSEGRYSFSGALDDVASALTLLRSRPDSRIDPKRLALVGHSVGGFLALMTAASDHDIRCTAALSPLNLGQFRAVIERSPEMKPTLEAALHGAAEGPLSGTSGASLVAEILDHPEFDLIHHAAELTRSPLLLVYANRDRVVPPKDNHDPLASAIRAIDPSRLEVLALDTDHAYSSRRIGLARSVVSWLERACGFQESTH